jgi:opine dehydrogenase
VVICPGSCGGALAFKRAAGLAVDDASIVVGETSTLPYAARADGEGNVQVFHTFDKGLFAAAVPRSGNSQLVATLRRVYPRSARRRRSSRPRCRTGTRSSIPQ